MTGVNESGRRAAEWESEAGAASDSPFPRGTTGAGEGGVDDEIVEAEMVDEDESADRITEIIGGDSPDVNAVTIVAAQRDEYLDSLRRLQAEFENYKKRVTKQQSDQTARAALSLVEKLLPVLDTLDLATAHLGDAGSDDGRALLAVSSQLRDVLAKEGLERIDPIGEEFDPNAHEAVGHVPADVPVAGGVVGPVDRPAATDAATSGATDAASATAATEPLVAQVMRPGYRWRGAVVRPAMVMVQG